MRLRQVVLAAHDLDATTAALRAALPLGPPHHDPAVALFGLRNAVMALGDTFVEVVAPERPDAAVARHLSRRGPSGYMVLVQVDDLPAARGRAAALGVREAWAVELPGISAVHLHPADTGGTLLSLDAPRDPAGWPWAGPSWRPHGAAAITGATIAVADPPAVGARWRDLLGGEAGLRFTEGDGGLVGVDVAGWDGEAVVGGVRFA